MKESGTEMTIFGDKSISASFIQTIIRYNLYSYTMFGKRRKCFLPTCTGGAVQSWADATRVVRSRRAFSFEEPPVL